MSYITDKCLMRVMEDTIATYKSDKAPDGVGTIGIDTDEQGYFIKNNTGLKGRVIGSEIEFTAPETNEIRRLPFDVAIAFAKAILRLAEAEEQKSEDGTVADLGIAPTGHKREPYHSLDLHDDPLEDDGW